ncbi:kynurenine formamidase [Paenibacillus cellulosilyticus]|uniref:Kynurenine formamidase n=1 Tax=Paenibacillus cellulosilyticus TaxID=375489 RepID=A0A2V2YBY2_9BACL|nr:cyclase family protein [Paenibacillus cellulosilyticus]PWV89359.1 kynurenine formamidase [Paenibacillus cellulosilyticus]QKS48781.1 cyclase family protein [Paenibacillus cellulosilyticus]
MFKIYDISMTVHEDMQVWGNKNSKQPLVKNVSNFDDGEVYESQLTMNLHCGTHVDAPLHMLKDGATIESIGLEELVGQARVLDLTHVQDSVSRADLERFGIQKGEWILLKTRNSLNESMTFDEQFVYVNEDGARYLIECGIRGVGVDGLGIERSQQDYPTHRQLFRNNIVIVEGLRLKHIHPGNYFLVVAPLKLTGVEAAPARAILIGGI